MTLFAPRADDGSDPLTLSHRLVGLHVAGIALMICLVLATAVWTSVEHNRLARDSSIELVANKLTALRARVFTLVRDYSIWSEGYAAVIEDDRPWLYSSIGSSVTEIGTFDLAMIVVPGGGEPFGWLSDSPPEGQTGLLPPELLAAILALVDDERRPTVDGRTLFAGFMGEPWAFAVARMSPVSGVPAGTDPSSLPRQIHGLRLTEERLDQIGAESMAADLSLSATVARGQASLPLVDYEGNVLTHVVWTPPQQGASILRRAAVPLAMVLAVATLLSAVSSLAAVRSARRLEAALRAAKQADRSKTEFLSNVSHELRTPMNGVLGAAQLLETTDLDPEQRGLLAVLLSSANAQMSLISDLIDLSRIDAGTGLVSEPFFPADVLGEVRDMMRVAAAKKLIRLEDAFECLEGVVLVGDARALRQIATNLVGNAVKFTDEGTVSIAASLTDETGRARLTMTVTDTGPGIPEESLARIFERFYQADGSMSRAAVGTGLGLAISQRLAHLMNGDIRVKSTLGRGSVFTFDAIFERAAATEERQHAA